MRLDLLSSILLFWVVAIGIKARVSRLMCWAELTLRASPTPTISRQRTLSSLTMAVFLHSQATLLQAMPLSPDYLLMVEASTIALIWAVRPPIPATPLQW